ADDAPPHRVTVEPFCHFLSHLARGGWAPGKSNGDPFSRQRPRVTPTMPVSRWVVQRLGAGPAVVLLGWLLGVLASPSGYDRLFVVRQRKGGRCVAATQAQIAAETGLSERQVKRALSVLRDEDLVISYTRRGRRRIRLLPETFAAGEEE